jgi:hypothetical protein
MTDAHALTGFVEASGEHRLREWPDGEWSIVEWCDDEVTYIGRSPEPGDSVVVLIADGRVEIYTIDLGAWTESEIAEARGLAALVGQWPGDETDEEIAEVLEELS